MAQWFAPLDEALGGIANAITGLTSTTGQAGGGLVAGLTEPFRNWILQLGTLALVAGIVVYGVA